MVTTALRVVTGFPGQFLSVLGVSGQGPSAGGAIPRDSLGPEACDIRLLRKVAPKPGTEGAGGRTLGESRSGPPHRCVPASRKEAPRSLCAAVARRPVGPRVPSCQRPCGSVSPRQPASEPNARLCRPRVWGAPYRPCVDMAPWLSSMFSSVLVALCPRPRRIWVGVLTCTVLCGLSLSLPGCPHPSGAPGPRAVVFLPVLRPSVTVRLICSSLGGGAGE